MKQDWRLSGQEEYLSGAQFKVSRFVSTEKSDHEHCSFCWDKFSDNENSLHTGYCTTDGLYWVCEQCFMDFKEQFNFKIIE